MQLQVTAANDKTVHLTVKHAAVAAARAVRADSVFKVFTDKRKSKHKSNIAGRQVKLWLWRDSALVLQAVQAVCKKYDCNAVCIQHRYNNHTYIQIMRNN